MRVAVPREVGHDFAGVGIADQCAHRHLQLDIVGTGAVAVGAVASFAVFGLVAFDKTVFHQRVGVFVGHRKHAAAAPAVAAVGAAARHEFFAAETDRAVAAASGRHFDFGFVDKLHNLSQGVFRQPESPKTGKGALYRKRHGALAIIVCSARQPERTMMDNQTERGWWRAALTALAGNLLTGAGSNLVFVVFFSRLEDWSEIFGLFLTVLLPWSLFSALIAAAAAGMAGWMMRDRAWHPRWRRRLFAASLLWGLISCVAVIRLVQSWVLVWPCSMLLTYFCLWPPKGFGKAA